MRIALAQLNATVGDLPGNEAKAAGAQLVVFPELVVTGYPPEDPWFKEHFLAGARACVDRLAERAVGIAAIIGSRSATTTSTTPRRCAPAGRSWGPTASCGCRTTASSTSCATSRAAASRRS